MAKTTFFEAPEGVSILAHKLIVTHHPEALGANIAFVMRSKASKACGKTKLAACILASEVQKTLHGYDFIIEIAADEWDGLEEKQREALLLHEILHIAGKEDEKTGNMTYGLQKHDTEEFRKVVEVYGLWTSDIAEMAEAIKKSEAE